MPELYDLGSKMLLRSGQLQKNKHVHSRYFQCISWTDAFKVLFCASNETMNVWTALGACILAGQLHSNTLQCQADDDDVPPTEEWQYTVILFATAVFIVHFLMVALYHTFLNVPPLYNLWSAIDLSMVTLGFTGVVLCAAAHGMTAVLFPAETPLETQVLVLGIFQLSVSAFVFYKRMQLDREAPLWLLIMINGMAGIVLPAVVHARGSESSFFGYFVLMLVIGTMLHVSHFPERAFPRTFDFIGSSHQVWHVLYSAALLLFVDYVLAYDHTCATTLYPWKPVT